MSCKIRVFMTVSILNNFLYIILMQSLIQVGQVVIKT